MLTLMSKKGRSSLDLISSRLYVGANFRQPHRVAPSARIPVNMGLVLEIDGGQTPPIYL